MKKTFKVSFPIYATGLDTVDVDEKELEGKSEVEIKELLISLVYVNVCHQCARTVEEPTYDDERAGKDMENVSYYPEEE